MENIKLVTPFEEKEENKNTRFSFEITKMWFLTAAWNERLYFFSSSGDDVPHFFSSSFFYPWNRRKKKCSCCVYINISRENNLKKKK